MSVNHAGRLLQCTLALALGLTVARARAEDAAPAWPSGPGSLSGVWQNSDYDRANNFDPRAQTVRTAEGKPPPLQPWAAALLEKRIQAALDGHPFATTKSQCLPSGVPQMMFGPGLLMQFLETPSQVTILNEELTYFRVIRLNGKHAAHPRPTYTGDSVGHWEGDTLVADTAGLTDSTTFDAPGTPHTGALHVVERFRRIGPQTIELKMAFDDPQAFTSPWTAITHFTMAPPDRRIQEWDCDNNRNLAVNGYVGIQPAGK